MKRVRQLPDGSYVEMDAKGRLLYCDRHDRLITEVIEGSDEYMRLGLRPHTDGTHRTYVNEYDPSTYDDPYALVWNNHALRYMTREESRRYTLSLPPPGRVNGHDASLWHKFVRFFKRAQ